MNFVSWAFAALFALVLLGRLTIGRRKIEPAYVALLIVASTVFYSWHIPVYLGILVFSASIDYWAAIWIANTPEAATRQRQAILAVSQEATAARLAGISVERISALTWGIAGFLAGVAGILLAGYIGLAAPGSLTGLALVPAFTAAVFGGVTSLPGALVGGIVIGVLESEAAANIPKDKLPGSGQVVLFVALLLVLLVRPSGLLGKET